MKDINSGVEQITASSEEQNFQPSCLAQAHTTEEAVHCRKTGRFPGKRKDIPRDGDTPYCGFPGCD